MAFASGYFKTSYRADLVLIETRLQWSMLGLLLAAAAIFPFVVSAFHIDLANQVFLAIVGAVSLGHAGLIAAGAFTTGILFKELDAAFWITLPASAVVGAILGVIFGLPSLRLKGIYLAVSTLALHFIVVFLGGEYETQRGFSTGIVVDPPRIGGFELFDPIAWYFVLFVFDVLVILFAVNLMRSRTGRAWNAIRDHDVVAEALGIPVKRYKLLAFVVSSSLTAVAGCLFAYYRGFVSVEAFSLFLTIQYVAMIIIGGLGHVLGAVLGAIFVTLLPYLIEFALDTLPVPDRLSSYVFAVNYASFGLIMILFLLLEPEGLVGIWQRIRDYFVMWPYRYRARSGE